MTKILDALARISAKDATGTVFSQIAAKMKGLEGVARGVNARQTAMIEGIGARIAAVAGPAALGAVAAKSVAAFADLDRRMTRVGLTADVTGAAVKGATKDVQRIAQEMALPTDQVVAALESLVAQGRSLPEAMRFLPSVVATAQAAGAETKDIATTAGAIGDAMGITADKMQSAFDILTAAGKAGKFELRDMARYLPALAPLAASVGMKGEEGLRRLAATAQVVRNQTGTAEEAAASLQNIFAKMESEETTKRFSKFGIDLRKEMAKARKEGKDLLTTFVELSDKAIKGDLSKVPQLFSDMEFARGMRALLSQAGAVDKLAASLRNVDGTVIRDLNSVLGDTKSAIDRAAQSWDTFKTRLGEKMAPAAEKLLNALNRSMDEPPAVDALPIIRPGAGLPETVAPADMRPGTFAEARRQDRAAEYVNPMASLARGRRVDIASPEDEGWGALAVARQREIATRAGGMTPGMAIARENELEQKIREQADLVVNQMRRRGLSREDAIALVDKTFGGQKIAEQVLRSEAHRTGGAAPNADQIRERYNSILDKEVTAKLEGSAEIGVKVEVAPSPDFMTRIETFVKSVVGPLSVNGAGSNGPGSVGTTMPDSAPRVGGGGP